jgi:glycosylphosphatidylinositol deacylase
MDKKHPNYGLYAYAEGKFGIPAKRHKFTGIPVLFVPGNAGSYKQGKFSLDFVSLKL